MAVVHLKRSLTDRKKAGAESLQVRLIYYYLISALVFFLFSGFTIVYFFWTNFETFVWKTQPSQWPQLLWLVEQHPPVGNEDTPAVASTKKKKKKQREGRGDGGFPFQTVAMLFHFQKEHYEKMLILKFTTSPSCQTSECTEKNTNQENLDK